MKLIFLGPQLEEEEEEEEEKNYLSILSIHVFLKLQGPKISHNGFSINSAHR